MEQRPKCKGLTVEYLIDSTEKRMLGNYTFQTSNGYNVEIKQRPHRIIDVSATEEVDIDVLYSILTKLEKLLMMMDGRFHVVERLYFHDSSTSKESDLIIAATHTLNHRLSLYSSRDFLKYACNKLIDYHDILDVELFDKWCVLLEQLDVVHQVFLYALADIKQPIDMICAFLIECAEPLIEIINDSQTFVERSSNEVGHVHTHIIIVIQYDVLPVSRVPVEPGGNVVATLTADIGCLVVNLHAILLQPLLQMEIGNGDLSPGGGHDDERTSGIHDSPELLQGGLIKQIIMIDADAFVEHLNGPCAIIEHAVHIEKNHFVHCQTSFRFRVYILLHR